MTSGLFFGIIFALLSDARAAPPPVCPPGTHGAAPSCVADTPAATDFCTQYAHVMSATPIAMTWGQPGSWQSSDSGAFNDNAVWVFKLTIPPGTPASTLAGALTVAEHHGPSTPRQMTISKQPCDFRGPDWSGNLGPFRISNGSSAQISYAVAAPSAFGPAGLSAGQTYYINVRNWQLDPTPQSSCGLPTCNAIMNEQPASAVPPPSGPTGNIDVATAASTSRRVADARAAPQPSVCPPGTHGVAPKCVADPPGTTDFCAQYAQVIPATPIAVTWGRPGSWQSSDSGALDDDTVWVFKLTIPAGTPASTLAGALTVAEHHGPKTPRQMTISKQPCDFREPDWSGNLGPFRISNGSSAQISYAVAAPSAFGPTGLSAGQTYYINVRNWQLDPTPQSSCGLPTCNAIMNEQPASAVPPPSGPTGNIDVATAASIRGWAADAAQQAGARVSFTVDGVVNSATVMAIQPRQDVQRVYPQFPINCGFSWTPPAGNHTINVYVLDPTGTPVEISGSPVTLDSDSRTPRIQRAGGTAQPPRDLAPVR